MLSILEMWWEYKARKVREKPIRTTHGFKVRKFGDKYAVISTGGLGRYQDIRNPGYNWTQANAWFKDCLGTKEEIEKRFGDFIEIA